MSETLSYVQVLVVQLPELQLEQFPQLYEDERRQPVLWPHLRAHVPEVRREVREPLEPLEPLKPLPVWAPPLAPTPTWPSVVEVRTEHVWRPLEAV